LVSTTRAMDGRSHVRWNQWALIIFLWLNRARVCVCVVGGLNQWTERDIFVHSVGVNESVKAFFSLCRPRLSVSLLVAINPMRASEPEGRMGRESKRSVCGGCVERRPSVFFFSSRCTAIRNDLNATLPHMRRERESLSEQIWFISMQFSVRVHVWNDGPRSQSGWGTQQSLLQSYQHHPDPSVLTSAALSKTHTHTHTLAAIGLWPLTQATGRAERERESAR